MCGHLRLKTALQGNQSKLCYTSKQFISLPGDWGTASCVGDLVRVLRSRDCHREAGLNRFLAYLVLSHPQCIGVLWALFASVPVPWPSCLVSCRLSQCISHGTHSPHPSFELSGWADGGCWALWLWELGIVLCTSEACLHRREAEGRGDFGLETLSNWYCQRQGQEWHTWLRLCDAATLFDFSGLLKMPEEVTVI